MTLIQLVMSDAMRYRVQSLMDIFVIGIPLLGKGVMDALGSAMGVASAVSIAGFLSLVVVAGVILRVPAIKSCETHKMG